MPNFQAITPLTPPGIFEISLIAAGVALPLLFLLVLVLLLRYARGNRQLLHLERMRSIEAGFPLEAVDPNEYQAKHIQSAFWIAFWVGFGVPAAALTAASAATEEISDSLGLGIVIWICAAAASTAAVICATVLMTTCRAARRDERRRASGAATARVSP